MRSFFCFLLLLVSLTSCRWGNHSSGEASDGSPGVAAPGTENGQSPLQLSGLINYQVTTSALNPGSTARIQQTASVHTVFPVLSMGCFLPFDLRALPGQNQIQSGSLQNEETWNLEFQVLLPNDSYRREIPCFAKGISEAGQEAAQSQVLLINPEGPMRVSNKPSRETRAPLGLELRSSGPLRPGATVNLHFEAEADIAHPALFLEIQLPAGVLLRSGSLRLGPLAVRAHQVVSLEASVQIPEHLPVSTLRALGQLGASPEAGNFKGMEWVELKTLPETGGGLP